MSSLFCRIATLCLATLLITQAYANGVHNKSPEFWLHRMNQALKTLNYEGTFVYIHDNHVESMRITHRADNEGGIERLISLTGPEREIIRDHKEVKCIIPQNHSVLVERRYAAAHFPAAFPRKLHTIGLITYYRIKELGEDRVAGHECKIIRIEPRDQYRYGYKLWLDLQTGMLLRSDLVARDGATVERVMFTSVSYPRKIPISALRATEIKPGYTWNIQGGSEKPTSIKTTLKWNARGLPPGFVLTMNKVQRLVGTIHPVRHLVFTDGLASVSVFSERVGPGSYHLIGPSRMGSVNAFGRQIGTHNITVVGEVPPITVRRVADSMRLEQRP